MCVGDAHGLRLYLTNEYQFLSLAPPTEQGCTIMHRAAEHGALDCGKMIWSIRPDSIYDCDKKVGGVITMATNFSNTMKIALDHLGRFSSVFTSHCNHRDVPLSTGLLHAAELTTVPSCWRRELTRLSGTIMT